MAEDKYDRPTERKNPGTTYDPEREIPDPEQVERDIEEAEKEYRGGEKKKPAA